MGRLHNHAVLLEEQSTESYMPYMTIGWKIFQCLFGTEQKYKIAQDGQSDADHRYRRRRYRKLQTTKMMGCPARIRIQEIISFPEFEISSDKVPFYQTEP